MTDIILQPDHRPRRIRPTRSWLLDHAKFFYHRAFSRFEIPNRPWFDDEGTALFERLLAESDLYLEYGSGGSTVLAATLGKTFLSVESDRRLSQNLRHRLGPAAAKGHIINADIGPTGAWGAPLLTRPNHQQLARWAHYVTAPWEQLGPGIRPDLVLVDGRFRVACTLYSLIRLQDKPATAILFDDYRWRSHYHVIADYAQVEQTAGRMALLRPAADIPVSRLIEALQEHIADWR